MEYIYQAQSTCAKQIKVELNDNVVTNIEFLGGGCNGNLKALPLILDGWTVDAIEERLTGITCGRRPTSCGDQLAKAVREAYSVSQQ